MMSKRLVVSIAAALVMGVASPAFAVLVDMDYSGTFAADDDYLLVPFYLDTDREVTLFTSSWDDGGFDPAVFIYDDADIWPGTGVAGWFQDDNNISGSETSNAVSYDFGASDVYLTTPTLSAGWYTAALVQAENYPGPNPGTAGSYPYSTDLADGFYRDGDPDWNSGFEGLTGDYEFHILNAVPEPASMVMLAALGAGLTAVRLRRRKSA